MAAPEPAEEHAVAVPGEVPAALSPVRSGSPQHGGSDALPSPKSSAGEREPEPQLKEPDAPAIAVRTDRLTCGAQCFAALMAISAFFLLESILLPWWTWTGRPEGDFWGMAPGAQDRFSPLTACNGGGRDPPGSTCVTVGSLATFLFIATAMSVVGAGIGAAVAYRYQWIFLLLSAALVAGGAAVLGGLSIWMAVSMQINGLTGEGVYLAFTGVCFAVAASGLAVWSANKATPSAGNLVTEVPEQKESRIVRSRLAQEAAMLMRQALEERHRELLQRRRSSAGASPAGPKKLDIVLDRNGNPVVKEVKKPRPMLKHVLEHTTGPDAGRPIPLRFLEAAFQEIDEDYSGYVEFAELAQALRDCGLEPSEESMARIMHEIDTDNSGQIEMGEFVAFFRLTWELYDWETKAESRKSVFAVALQCGFFTNVIALAVIITVQSRSSGSSDGQQLGTISQILMISFLLLFLSVIVSPLARMTLGPSLIAWFDVVAFYVKRSYRRWMDRRAAAQRERERLDELARKAEEFEIASAAPSPDASPRSRGSRTSGAEGRSAQPDSPSNASSLRALGWAGGSSSPMSRNSRSGQGRRGSFSGPGLASEDEEEDDGSDKPGVYLIVHDGTAVRTGISNNSSRISVLRRGQKVRIVEIFEYARQHRVRGRIQSAPGKTERHWISLRDTTDDYCWAKRVGPLQEESEWMKKARQRRLSASGGVQRASRRSRATSPPGSPTAPPATIAVDDVNQTPAYDPAMFDDAEKRLWNETYSDGYIKVFCMRSRWATKERLVVDLFVERVFDAEYKPPEESEDGPPGSRVRDVKLELPPEVVMQAIVSEHPQRELKDGLLLLCRDELVDVGPTVSLWVWPHPELNQRWLTPNSSALPGCCVKYELLRPGKLDEDVYVQSCLRWDQWLQQKCFTSLMQVHDTRRHLSLADEMPDEREVQGGLTQDRGEWRLGLNDR